MLTEPAPHNFEIVQNGRFEWYIQLFIEGASGQEVVPLSGWTARLVVRSSVDSDDQVLELSSANGRVSVTADDEFLLTLTASTTNALTPWEDPAVYYLRLTPPDEEPFFLLYGLCRFVKTTVR